MVNIVLSLVLEADMKYQGLVGLDGITGERVLDQARSEVTAAGREMFNPFGFSGKLGDPEFEAVRLHLTKNPDAWECLKQKAAARNRARKAAEGGTSVMVL